jgi:hypothetical protein
MFSKYIIAIFETQFLSFLKTTETLLDKFMYQIFSWRMFKKYMKMKAHNLIKTYFDQIRSIAAILLSFPE